MSGIKFSTWIWTAILACCAFIVPAIAQDDKGAPPSIKVGNWLVVDPRAKIQLDLSAFKPELDVKHTILQGRRIRFGADGALFRDLAYTVRVETKRGAEFRDVFLKYQRFDSFQVQAGRFKIPFGLDQLTDSGELDFVHRSRIGSIVAPGRDTGLMILGETPEGTLHYSTGIFRHDGRNSEVEDFAAVNEVEPGGNKTVAARVTVQPAAIFAASIPMRNLTVGAAFTHSDLTTGLSSLPGLTASGQVFFPRMYVSGARLRRGAELSGSLGSLSIKGEFMDAREERLGQGQRGEDLPALRTQGWYLSAVQRVLGHRDNARPVGFLRSILPGRQLGLVEATARYEMIRFGSVSSNSASPSRSPRAANVVANDDRAWTFGINWHASRYLKLQFNGVRETLLDPVRTPIDGESHYWTLATRLQIYF
jgi:phosphate-selective porin OprO and OprP